MGNRIVLALTTFGLTFTTGEMFNEAKATGEGWAIGLTAWLAICTVASALAIWKKRN